MAPLLPLAPRRGHRHPGRLRVPGRAALAGIMYVLRTGVAWRDVPAETVGRSGVTASSTVVGGVLLAAVERRRTLPRRRRGGPGDPGIRWIPGVHRHPGTGGCPHSWRTAAARTVNPWHFSMS
ncbi:transposase [Streptosporangium nondiastaticum]|uniref:transposase n=1 Tax=Streptosporangium nondiastaticum TaxID=35764 RepID=UPI003F4ACF27